MSDNVDGNIEQPGRRSVGVWALVGVGVGLAIVLLLGAVLVVLLLEDSGDNGPSTVKGGKTLTVTGTLELIGDVDGTTENCWGSGGYSDLGEGTQVIVRDDSGKTVGIGSLDAGSVPERFDFGDTIVSCGWSFTVEEVTSGAASYSVEVAHRGEIAFTEDEAESVALTLGS